MPRPDGTLRTAAGWTNGRGIATHWRSPTVWRTAPRSASTSMAATSAASAARWMMRRPAPPEASLPDIRMTLSPTSGPTATPSDQFRIMTPTELRRRWRAGEEVALLDVREEGPYSLSHPFFAVSLPLSQIELRLLDLVP